MIAHQSSIAMSPNHAPIALQGEFLSDVVVDEGGIVVFLVVDDEEADDDEIDDVVVEVNDGGFAVVVGVSVVILSIVVVCVPSAFVVVCVPSVGFVVCVPSVGVVVCVPSVGVVVVVEDDIVELVGVPVDDEDESDSVVFVEAAKVDVTCGAVVASCVVDAVVGLLSVLMILISAQFQKFSWPGPHPTQQVPVVLSQPQLFPVLYIHCNTQFSHETSSGNFNPTLNSPVPVI